jgi:hypothetical protein
MPKLRRLHFASAPADNMRRSQVIPKWARDEAKGLTNIVVWYYHHVDKTLLSFSDFCDNIFCDEEMIHQKISRGPVRRHCQKMLCDYKKPGRKLPTLQPEDFHPMHTDNHVFSPLLIEKLETSFLPVCRETTTAKPSTPLQTNTTTRMSTIRSDPPANAGYEEVDKELPIFDVTEGINPLNYTGNLLMTLYEKDKTVPGTEGTIKSDALGMYFGFQNGERFISCEIAGDGDHVLTKTSAIPASLTEDPEDVVESMNGAMGECESRNYAFKKAVTQYKSNKQVDKVKYRYFKLPQKISNRYFNNAEMLTSTDSLVLNPFARFNLENVFNQDLQNNFDTFYYVCAPIVGTGGSAVGEVQK